MLQSKKSFKKNWKKLKVDFVFFRKTFTLKDLSKKRSCRDSFIKKHEDFKDLKLLFLLRQ